MRVANTRLALFDLDGTLVDSAPDLADAVDAALIAHGFEPPGEALVRGFIGNGAGILIHRAITGEVDSTAPKALFDSVHAQFLDCYAERLFVRSQIYSGVVATLQALASRGWLLACVTNKSARFTEPLLKLAALDPHFALIVSGDSLARKKPDPDQLLHAAATLGVTLDRVIMIGDSITDLNAAQNAGVPCVCVSYGYHANIDLSQHGADHLIDDMSTLPDLLTRHYFTGELSRTGT